MKYYLASLKMEFVERVFSSPKRVVKFIAICFVPFLYAFVCIWAFWNPIPKIGNAPMAIVSLDQRVLLVAGFDANQDKLAFGAAKYYETKKDSGVYNPFAYNTDWDIIDSGAKIITTTGTVIVKDNMTVHAQTSLVDDLINSWKANLVPSVKYDKDNNKFNLKVNDSMQLSNVSYLNNNEASKVANQTNDGKWNTKDKETYWSQLQLPHNLSENIISFLDATFRNITGAQGTDIKDYKHDANEFLTDLQSKNAMQFWSTYKHNFLYGQFMYIFNEFKNSLILDLGPQVLKDLFPLITNKLINNNLANLSLVAKEDLKGNVTFKDYLNVNETVDYSMTKDKPYVIRNQEMLNALLKENPDKFKTKPISFEGSTLIDKPDQDWATDGFVNSIANSWNKLMSGIKGQILSQILAKVINDKIADALQTEGITVDSDGVRKMFSTSANVAGFLEEKGNIIPEDSKANFSFYLDGEPCFKFNEVIDMAQSKFKDLGLVNILSNNHEQDNSSYVLDVGDPNKPVKGTFVYNIQNNLSVISNQIFASNKLLNSFLDAVLQNILKISTFNVESLFPNLNNIVNTNIEGSQFNPYGIGLGQFFLCIGLWVGTLMQTFVFDRAKRVKKAGPFSWYLSKTTLMLITGWIQCTILMLSVYALGWSIIGPAFGLMYLWMMLTTTAFVVIEQALWFSLKDETIGKFLCIILLIINLSAGWGTFPPFMQSGIFRILSYIAPYTYSIHGQGVIIYGIGVNGINLIESLYILQQFGFLLVWIFVFLAIGLFVSQKRNREMLYGTHSAKKLGSVLIQANLNKYVNAKNEAMWKKLPNEVLPFVCEKVKELYPEEKQFKWYKKWKIHHQDQTLISSASDEEIMRRND